MNMSNNDIQIIIKNLNALPIELKKKIFTRTETKQVNSVNNKTSQAGFQLIKIVIKILMYACIIRALTSGVTNLNSANKVFTYTLSAILLFFALMMIPDNYEQTAVTETEKHFEDISDDKVSDATRDLFDSTFSTKEQYEIVQEVKFAYQCGLKDRTDDILNKQTTLKTTVKALQNIQFDSSVAPIKIEKLKKIYFNKLGQLDNDLLDLIKPELEKVLPRVVKAHAYNAFSKNTRKKFANDFADEAINTLESEDK